MTIQKFVSWVAVSSNPQAEKISPTRQRELNNEHIARHGGVLVEELVVTDARGREGASRSIILLEDASRLIPAYARLRELIDTRAFDWLIFYDRTRLGREASLIMAIEALCRDARIGLYKTTSPPETLNYADGYDQRLISAIESVGAQEEIHKLRERHLGGMMERVQGGHFPGVVPFGWRVRYTETGEQVIELDPVAASMIRLALIDLYLEMGRGMHAVAAEMSRRGHTWLDGNPWTWHGVQHLLRMVHRYAGYVEINKAGERPYVRAKGNFPPIFSEDEMDSLLQERARRATGARRINAKYRYSGVAWCNVCNRPMHGDTTRFRNKKYVYTRYVCAKRGAHTGGIMEHKVETAVREYIGFLQACGDVAELLPPPEDAAGQTQSQITLLGGEIEKYRTALERVDNAYAMGIIDSDERYRAQVDTIQAQIASAQSQMDRLRSKISSADDRARSVSRLEDLRNSGLTWLDMDDRMAARTKLQRTLRVWVQENKVFSVEPVI